MTTQREREKITRRKLFCYARYAQDLADFEESIVFGARQFDITGIHGTGISDPSARKGIALADMTDEMKYKKAWIEAIDNGLEELARMDKGNDRGYKYICMHMFGIPTRRQMCGTVRIAIECNMARSTVYQRLQTILNVMIFHAGLKGLL